MCIEKGFSGLTSEILFTLPFSFQWLLIGHLACTNSCSLSIYMHIVSFNPQNNPRKWALGKHLGTRVTFWEFFKSIYCIYTFPLNFLKTLHLVRMTTEPIIFILQMWKMRLREERYFVVINGSGRISCCKSGLLRVKWTGCSGLVYSPTWSYLIPAPKDKESVFLLTVVLLEKRREKRKLERSP